MRKCRIPLRLRLSDHDKLAPNLKTQVAIQATVKTDGMEWSLGKRFFFRLLFCYITLLLLPSAKLEGLSEFVPGTSAVAKLISGVWRQVLPWFAVNVLHLTGPSVTVYKASGTTDQALD